MRLNVSFVSQNAKQLNTRLNSTRTILQIENWHDVFVSTNVAKLKNNVIRIEFHIANGKFE